MKIGEIAKKTGVSVHTLRYYEHIGLLPPVYRDQSGQRVYETSTLAWLEFLGRLKTTGMPIRDMLRYAQLRQQGPETGPQRRKLLEEHRDKVRDNVAELQQCLLVLDFKINTYEEERTQHEHSKPAVCGGKQDGPWQTGPVRD